MTTLLTKLGLRTSADYDALKISLDDERAETKRLRGLLADKDAAFKKAIGDVADQADEIAAIKSDFNQRLADAVQDFQVDAQKWRDRAAREHARRAKTRSAVAVASVAKGRAVAKKGAK